MKKRILSVLLCFVIVLGMMPTVAFAEGTGGTGKAIQLDTSAILGLDKNVSTDDGYKPNSYIYFGYESGAAVKWRVLEADVANDGTTGRMFLLSENMLGKTEDKSVRFDVNGKSATYQGSSAQTWCKGFKEWYFTPTEQGAMIGITKTETGNTSFGTDITLNACGLSGDQMFFLSAQELEQYVGNYTGSTNIDESTGVKTWWLRSAYVGNNGAFIGAGYAGGNLVSAAGVDSASIWARPAMNLDKSQILFISAADDNGKSAQGTDSGLTQMSYYDSNEWKLTLKDAKRTLNVGESSISGYVGGSVTLNYSNATLDNTWVKDNDNNYISAMVVNSEKEVLYYGRVQKLNSESGTVNIALPEGLAAGNYTLKVFNEQYNGVNETDYASEFCNVALEVKNPGEARIVKADGTTNEYPTLGEALTEAKKETKNVTIDVLTTNSLTLGDNTTYTLKQGDTIRTDARKNDSEYVFGSQITAESGDVGVGVYNLSDGYETCGFVKFTSGTVKIETGRAYLSGSASATGKTGVTITNKVETGVITVITREENVVYEFVNVMKGGKVKIGNAEYAEGSDPEDSDNNGGMGILVTNEYGNVLYNGAVKLGKSGSIKVKCDYSYVAVTNTGEDAITVSQYGEIIVPASGKVQIGDTEYTAETDAVFGISEKSDGESTKVVGVLAKGSVTLDAGKEIIAYLDANYRNKKYIQNTGNAGVTVAVIDNGQGKPNGATVTVPEGNKVKIGDTEYAVGTSGATFEIDNQGNVTLKSGSATLNSGESVKVGGYSVNNTNPADSGKDIVVSAGETNTATVPNDGSVKFQNATIANVKQKTVFTIDGSAVTAKLSKGQSVTVKGMAYTGGEGGGTLSIKPETGEVTVTEGNIIRTIDPDALTEEFEYELEPGKSITIGKYTYTAPEGASKGDVTIKGQGIGKNPAVVLKKENGTVEVALADSSETKTTYTAVNANTKFAMSDSDTDTTKIDLLSNNNTTANSKIKIANGVAVTVGTQAITATADNTVIGLLSENTAKLYEGAARTTGAITATINGGDKSFDSEAEYTVNTSGSLTLNSGSKAAPASVTMSEAVGKNITFKGSANDTFNLSKSDDGNTVTVPAKASITVKDVTITGVAKETGDDDAKDTKVKIDIATGALTLVEGKGSVTGETTVAVKVDGANVNVTVPTGKTYVIDADNGKVSGIAKGSDVTIGDVTYTSGTNNGSFSIAGSNAGKLTNNGDKAVVPNGKSATIILGSGTTPIVSVPSENTGSTTITKGTASTVVLEKQGDKFTVGDKTYTADSVNAEFTVDQNGNVTRTIPNGGTATLSDGYSAIGESGKLIENPANSQNDTITVRAEDGKDTVTVPAKGKVVIDSVEYENASTTAMTIEVTKNGGNKLTGGAVMLDNGETVNVGTVTVTNTGGGNKTVTVEANAPEVNKNSVVVPAGGKATIGGVEYQAGEKEATFVIDKDGNVTLTSGEAVIADGKSITGMSGKVITNPTGSGEDRITVKAEDNKDIVTVEAGTANTVKIGGTTYTNGSDDEAMVIEVTADGNKLTDGAVALDSGEQILVGSGNVLVVNEGDETITVTANANGTGNVAVPAGGTFTAGMNKVGNTGSETVGFTIDENGGISTPTLSKGQTVEINGVKYTGGDKEDGKVSVDADGKVTIAGDVKVNIDPKNFDNPEFSYTLIPGQEVTVGKYTYKIPAEPENTTDTTLIGRAPVDGESQNPIISIGTVANTIDVALEADSATKTTYTAANASTMFAMAADDTDTTKVELLNNKAKPNSALKFTDKDSHVVNGVTYQAQEIKNNGTVQNIAYTVTYGEETNEDESVSNHNTVSVESGSKVIAKMTAKGTIYIKGGKIGDKDVAENIPFTAANNNASVLIDNTEGTGKSKISGNGSYLTEIKDESGNVTGYEVRKRSSGGSTSTTTTDNVTNTTEDKKTETGSTTETTKVATTTATVKTETKTSADGSKTTTATVDKTTADKIVEKAVTNKSEEVVVNTGSSVTETAAGSTAEIQLPEQTVQGLSQKTEASVTIKSESAEVTLDKAAVDGLASQAGNDGFVKLVVETVKQDAQLLQVDLKLVTSKGNVTDFKGGNVSVTVKLNASLAAKPVVCVYIDDFGTYHKVKGLKKTDGTYTFETSHFSTYAVMAEEDADKIIAEQTAKVEKLVGDLTLKACSAKTAKGNIKVTLTVDADDIRQIEDLGYTVKYKFYRSTKKSKGYKAAIEKTGKTYTNTAGTKGTRYYYKARVMVYDAQGALVAKTALKQCRYACRVK